MSGSFIRKRKSSKYLRDATEDVQRYNIRRAKLHIIQVALEFFIFFEAVTFQGL